MANCATAFPSAVPTDDCLCPPPGGCLPSRMFTAARRMVWNALHPDPRQLAPFNRRDPEYFLHFAHPEFGTFAINRYSGAGSSIEWQNRDADFNGAIDDDGRQYMSQPITPTEVQGDLDQLFAQEWPSVNDPTYGLLPSGSRVNRPFVILPTFRDDGSIFLRVADERDELANVRACCYSENSIVMRGPCDNVIAPDIDAQSPWRVTRTLLLKIRGQARSTPGVRHCLYDIAVPLCSAPSGVKLNCRSITVGDDGVVDVPLPPLGFATILDEFCDCE